VFSIGSEDVGYQVRDDGVVFEGNESVPQSWFHDDRLARFACESHAVPLTECGRTNTDVNDVIDDRPGDRHDVLRLARGNVGVMNPSNDTFRRTGDIALNGDETVPRSVADVVSSKPLRKESSVITKDSGGYSPRTSDTQWLNVHKAIVAKRGTTVNSVTVVVDQIVAPVPGGIGRYALNLIRALSERANDSQKLVGYVPRVPRDTVRELESLLPLLHGFEMSPLARGLVGRAWRYGIAVPRKQFTYSPSLFAPLTETGSHIDTIHDAVPWTHPETLTPHGVAWHRAMAARAERFADIVVVPTEAVAARLSTYLDLGDRIRVIGGAPSADLVVPVDSAARRTTLGVPDRYITFVGTLEPRKGLEQLMTSLAVIDDLPLVLIGPMGWGGVDVPTLVARTGIDPSRVIALGRLDDADLVSVLAGSRALVVPSLDEGFGLPVLEAMTLGIPVIHSTAEALLEVAGGAAIAVDVHGVNGTIALAEALTGLDDETLRRDLASRGRARAAAFSWDSSATVLGAVIDDLS